MRVRRPFAEAKLNQSLGFGSILRREDKEMVEPQTAWDLRCLQSFAILT